MTTVGSHGEDAGGSCAREGCHQDEGGDASLLGIGSGAGRAPRNLDRMGCIKLLSKPWVLKSKYMLRELLVGAPYRFKTSIRARPSHWTALVWRAAYDFGTKGQGICGRGEDFTIGRFHHPVHSKDGYLTADCKDPRARRVLEFLVPILLSDKGARVTMGIASTILG
ncbi:MAG TPA: hypothetical protein VF679_09470, partial [Pedobacter sp.]